MKNLQVMAVFSLVALLGACGGGGNDGQAGAPSTQISALDDLTAKTGTASSTQSKTLCGVNVGTNLLQGSVTDVHDGDTITLSVTGTLYKIRLDSIDAPELAQPFGSLSQTALATAVQGKTVQVAYTKTDQYGRIVGAVFNDRCEYINLSQVSAGMAWFYKAYQCEVSATVRSQFAQAQDAAATAKIGLWSQAAPTAPWVYRNGVDPVAPTCSADSATWPGNPESTSSSSGSSGSSGSSSSSSGSGSSGSSGSSSGSTTGCSMVWVNGYTRSNGTYVNGYWRHSPGCA